MPSPVCFPNPRNPRTLSPVFYRPKTPVEVCLGLAAVPFQILRFCGASPVEGQGDQWRIEFLANLRENSVMLRGWNMVKLISLMQSIKNKVSYLTIDQASLADIHANRGELYVQLIDIQQTENTAFLNLLNLHRIWSFLSVFSWKLAMTSLEAAKIVGHGDVQNSRISHLQVKSWYPHCWYV